MPLFVPILRIAMLFLNVYDSYKTLKQPPSSSRDPTRPSVRALTQRKRDIKGCIAVWIVWCCFTTYERLLESLVCLFIPFYNEVKSMCMLFLILTRAKGAEPIFLHLIRPLVRPYTVTLDASLDVLRMLGDFIFALSVFPLQVALKWWHNSVHLDFFSFNFEISDSDSENTSDTSNNLDVRSPETSNVTSSTPPQSVETPESRTSVDTPRRPGPKRLGLAQQARRSSSDTVRSSTRQSPKSSSSQQVEPNFYNTKKRNQASTSSSQHKIWYPPQSAYDDEEPSTSTGEYNDPNTTTDRSAEIVRLSREEIEVEEWRQYPAFPSAYPPTPLVTTSRLVATTISANPSLYPAIEEELPRQDFRQSLLPPREPLNPGFVGGLSDYHSTPFGIPHSEILASASSRALDTENDSISDDDDYVDEEEEEDIYNLTLRTPLRPYGSLRSRIISKVSPSVSSAASVPSRSTALTTVADGLSSRTRTSSESSSSISASASMTDASSLELGQSQSHPQDTTVTASVLARVRQLESNISQDNQVSRSSELKSRRKPQVKKRKVSRPQVEREASTSETADDDGESASGISAEEAYIPGEQKSPDVKRRKIVASPRRIVSTSRVVRPRVTKHASPPMRNKSQAPIASSSPMRKSSRIRSSQNTTTRAGPADAPPTTTTTTPLESSSLSNTKSQGNLGRKAGVKQKPKP